VNLAALVASEAALNDRVAMERYVNGVKRLRAWFAQELGKLGVKTLPERREFPPCEFRAKRAGAFSEAGEAGILLRERSKDIGPGFVRITIGTQSEMQRLLKTIRNE